MFSAENTTMRFPRLVIDVSNQLSLHIHFYAAAAAPPPPSAVNERTVGNKKNRLVVPRSAGINADLIDLYAKNVPLCHLKSLRYAPFD